MRKLFPNHEPNQEIHAITAAKIWRCPVCLQWWKHYKKAKKHVLGHFKVSKGVIL